MIITKSWPIHWGFWCYLPVAILWSVLFYCIQGTVDYEAEEDDDEEEEEQKNPIAKGLGALGKLASNL